jgi:uncharacterized membrane protein
MDFILQVLWMADLILLDVILELIDSLTTFLIARDFPDKIHRETNKRTRALLEKYGAIGAFKDGGFYIIKVVLLITLIFILIFFLKLDFISSIIYALFGYAIIQIYPPVANMRFYSKCKKEKIKEYEIRRGLENVGQLPQNINQ